MSFGDQNNPYGQPPQAAPYPQGGQPYGAYPQQGGYSGMPPVPAEMPGVTKAARIFMWIIAVSHLAIAGIYGVALAAFNDVVKNSDDTSVDMDKVADFGKGLIGFLVALAAVFAVIGIILALRYAKGGNGVRVGSIVYASFAIISGIVNIGAWGLGLVVFILAILTIVFCAKRASAEWFQRPRY
ncbi:hypothetical protein I5Q34_17085 [Streptomyces sp. AV19]|uniref:proline-rich domain-containing protein n=1 Tax=Streptomyces sp. AV19 TaxID=2793068 RepID=UPI0018FE4D11|nr:hypothetical protein [Streptomyces sp. AV19]MBH1935962.1 hypothetical protein [Streptomyces sp. AV19]MDG4534246.1 hypothetical protein [Streptomyces sp. AV19]